jgi:hypothetical protein
MLEIERCLEGCESGRDERIPYLLGTFALWAVALEDGLRRIHGADYGELREKTATGQVMPGMRLARNAVAHGQLICARATGISYPLTYPLDYGPWIWKSLPELLETWQPDKSDWLPGQYTSYEHHFVHREIADPMKMSTAWLKEFTAY